MITTTIYLQDLKEAVQCRIWQNVQNELLAQGLIEPQQEDETDEAFDQRLQEQVDYYLNCHNTAQEICI